MPGLDSRPSPPSARGRRAGGAAGRERPAARHRGRAVDRERGPAGKSALGLLGPIPARVHGDVKDKLLTIGIVDLVSRKWVATLVSAEESTTHARTLFLDALEAEGLLAGVEERLVRPETLLAVDVEDERVPVLLAVSPEPAPRGAEGRVCPAPR